MSWSITGYCSIASAKEDIPKLRDAAVSQNPDCGDQFEAAAAAAVAIVESGAVGGGEKTFSVTLSGHSNPDHEPHSGWSPDGVNVSVAQVIA
jgi:hypothetical protein